MKRIRLTWVAYAIMICSLTTFAQPDTLWTRTGSEDGTIVQILAVNDGVVCLSTHSITDSDSTWHMESDATKLSNNGDTLWVREIRGPQLNTEVQEARANGEKILVFVNSYDTPDSRSQHVATLSFAGDNLGTVALPAGTQWRSFDVTRNGQRLFCGDDNQYDLHLLALDSLNQITWERLIGEETYYEECTSIVTADNGDILIVGYRSLLELGSSRDAMAIRLDEQGQELWTRVESNDLDYDYFMDVCIAPDSGFLISGCEDGFFGTGGWFLRIDQSGNTLWTHHTSAADEGYPMIAPRVFPAMGGGYYGVGLATSNHMPWIVKLAEDSNVVYQRCCWGSNFIDQISSGAETSQGTLFLGGRSYPSHGAVPYLVRFADDISSDLENTPEISNEFALHPNYPNPFNATTEITFDLPRALQTSLKVYDVLGREVAELAGGVMNAGSHTIIYDASGLSSGVYFYRLEAGEFGETRKMVLLR